MLYLATFTLKTQLYPDNETEQEVTRLVRAESEEHAWVKITAHYAAKDDPYAVSYTVRRGSLSEIIE